jgi:ribonuclease inhibitor
MSTPSLVEIDLEGVPDAVEMHERIAAALSFPGYYGQNWDAFDECMAELETPPKKIRILGFQHLTSSMPREAALLKTCFADFLATPKGSTVTLEIP